MRIQVELLPHQKKVLKSESYITSMSCGVGAGKSFMAAFMAIFWMLKGKRVLVIMPTYGSIRDTLIFQMTQILNNWGMAYRLNKTLNTITVGNGTMISRSGEAPEDINGLTQIDVVIMDECRLIPEIAYTYAISRQRGVDNAKVYLFGTGCSKRAWFARESMLDTTMWVTGSCLDNVKHNGKDYVERMQGKYKSCEQYFIDRELYGKFTDGDEQSLFMEINANALWKPGAVFGGMDLAINGGSDYSAAAIFSGNKLIYLGKRKTLGMPAAQRWLDELKARYNCKDWFHDHTGLGNDLILEGSSPMQFGMPGIKPYGSLRAQMYFELKQMLADGICIEYDEYRKLFDEEVVAELNETKTIDREMRNILLIPKDEIRAALNRSPDLSDALALAAHCGRCGVDEMDWNEIRARQVASNPFRRA
jgi:hypothetical protein